MPKKYVTMRRRVRRTAHKALRTTRRSLYKSPQGRSLTQDRALQWSRMSAISTHKDAPLTNFRGFMPEHLYTQHRYVKTQVFTTDNFTGLTSSEIAFRLNSLYDPEFLLGGHQPLGFDQLTPIYNKYIVYKVKIQVRVLQSSAPGMYLAVNCRPSTATYNLQAKFAAEIQEQPANTIIDAQTPRDYDFEVWVADVQGVKRAQIWTDEYYSGSAATNPSLTPYCSVAGGNYGQTTGVSTSAMISLTFFARWSNQNPLAQS